MTWQEFKIAIENHVKIYSDEDVNKLEIAYIDLSYVSKPELIDIGFVESKTAGKMLAIAMKE